MDGNNKLGIFLAGLCFIVLAALWKPVFAEDPKPQAQQAGQPQVQSQKGLSGLNMQGFDKKSDEKINWSNNPFVQPANDVPISDLRLSGIVYNKDEAAAIINDQIVQKGDKIGAHQVVDITKNNVLLRNENGLFGLGLKGGNQ